MSDQNCKKENSITDLMTRFPKLDDENNDFDQLSRAFASEFQELEKLSEDQKRAVVLSKLSKESRIRLENMLPSGKTLADISWKSSDSKEVTLYNIIKRCFGKRKSTLISIYGILNGGELENSDEAEHAAAISRFVELEQKMITADAIKIILSIQTIKNEQLKEAMGSKLKRGKFSTFKEYYTILEDNLEKEVIQINKLNIKERSKRKPKKKLNIPQELLGKCLKCGEEGHFADKCTVTNLVCTLCKRKNHTNKACFNQFNNKFVKVYTAVSSSNCFFKTLVVERECVVNFLVDSGADRSFLDVKIVEKLNEVHKIRKINFDAVDYNENKVKLLSEWFLRVMEYIFL